MITICLMLKSGQTPLRQCQCSLIPCLPKYSLIPWLKLFLEEIARDIQKAEPDWKIILLRYFNPVGAHESGKLGEDPKGIPNNLMPYIQQVAVGRLPELNVYGHDYPTRDGSAVCSFFFHVFALELSVM